MEFRRLERLDLRDCCSLRRVTRAEYDDSVSYVDYGDEEDSSHPIFLTLPYVCGQVQLASDLDSLVTMVHTNSISRNVPELFSLFLQRVSIAYAKRCISHDRFCPSDRPSDRPSVTVRQWRRQDLA